MTTILITAGGTGGHVFPALAVAHELRARGAKVMWLGTREGIESRLVPAAGIDIEYLKIRSLRGGGWLRWLLFPMQLNLAMLQAWRLLRRLRPDVVLAMGGYAAGPGSLMASLLRIPLVVHEQNAIAGLTNRWLARLADVLLAGFPGVFSDRHGVRVVGNPVRPEILAIEPPRQRFTGRTGRLRVLVIGGSQGAQILNNTLPEAIQHMPAEIRPEIWHQTGVRDEQAVATAYRACVTDARVSAFIDDMATAYAWADLVVCRAGAMTIAELAVAGVASLLVPLPHAADDHQTANAQYLATHHAAELVPQREFSPTRVAELLTDLVDNRETLLQMAEQARACAVTDATETVAGICLDAAHA